MGTISPYRYAPSDKRYVIHWSAAEPTAAMRATELYPGAPLFCDDISFNDIVQGAVGDCFFIGAVRCGAEAAEGVTCPLCSCGWISHFRGALAWKGKALFKNNKA